MRSDTVFCLVQEMFAQAEKGSIWADVEKNENKHTHTHEHNRLVTQLG